MSTPESVSAWDEAMENSLIEQKPAYASDIPSAATTAVPGQRLQDFRWMSAAKSEPDAGLHLAKLHSVTAKG